MKRKGFFVLLNSVLLVFSAVLGGCSDGKGNQTPGSSSSGTPAYGGSVVVGIQQDIDSLDPHKAVAAGTREILFNIFEGLVKPDENGNLINALASGYTLSADHLVYTFTLRDGVKFHNGNPVTAEDVKYSLERAAGLNGGAALISALKKISSVHIVDPKTVEVALSSADTEMIYNLAAAVIPKPEDGREPSQPIGTGPFKFVSYTPQSGVVVEKNADYWQKGVPYLDSVTFKMVSGTDAALLELKAGAIDIYPYLTDSQAAELQNVLNVEYDASNVVQALFLNNARAPFDNVKVRQAMNYAVDRQAVNTLVAGGRATPVAAPMLPGLSAYYEDCTGLYSHSPEKAKSLLAEAGYPGGFEMTITVPANYSFHMQTAEVIVEQLKKVGITAKIEGVEWNTWLEQVYNGRNYQSTVCGITSNLSPNYLLNRFASDSSKNFVNFSSDEYDQVYQMAVAATEDAQKQQHYKRLQQILAQEAGSVYTQVSPLIVAVNKKLGGYKFYPVYVQDMSSVYFIQ